MDSAIPIRHAPTLRSAFAFLSIGVAIYAALLGGSEWLVLRNGHMNPVFKIERAGAEYDWVVLGASHAMPLDFDGFSAEMEEATGLRILNLAGPGTGPLYNRLVLEHLLRDRTTRNVLYVVDSFAFRSPQWNEERLADFGLLSRTPFSLALAGRLARYVLDDGVDPRAVLAYVSGFPKLNDRDRFEVDRWEGEARFDRVFRPSASADRKRVEYLYPPVDDETAQQARYLNELATIMDAAKRAGAKVTLARFPLPARFRALLPREAEFDALLAALATKHSVSLLDLSSAVEGNEFYADTDHLNRAGVRRLFVHHLREVLGQGLPPSAYVVPLPRQRFPG